MRSIRAVALAGLAVAAITLGVVGCKEEGPAEKGGKQMDKAAAKAADAAGNAADKAADAAHKAADKMGK